MLCLLGITFVHCSKGQLISDVLPTLTTITITTTTLSFGVCGTDVCTGTFCAENCESPDKCHVKDVRGICYPSCGYLAHLQGYGGYGPDHERRTSDDPHSLTKEPNTTCSDLNIGGVTDWKKIPLIDGLEPYEVVEGGGECCGSEEQLAKNRMAFTTATTTTTLSFGVCGTDVCTGTFCAENCESPDRCHVKDVRGVCRPSCGYLAHLQGYGGYGPDNEKKTSDDPHFLTKKANISCSDLNIGGATDWEKIPLIDDVEPHEVAEGGGECCGSKQQMK